MGIFCFFLITGSFLLCYVSIYLSIKILNV